MESAPNIQQATPSPFSTSVVDRVPTEVLCALGEYFDRSTLCAAIRVSKRWCQTFLPFLWSKIDIQQWHHPGFPPLKFLLPKSVEQVHNRSNNSRNYWDSVVMEMISHIRVLEWWSNDSITKAHKSFWTYTTFRSALSYSAMAAAKRGEQSVEHPYQSWCFDGTTRLSGHHPLPAVTGPILGPFLTESLNNLTSLSLRLGPYEDFEFLRSLVYLPHTMKHLRLVGWKWRYEPCVAIETLFPLFSKLEELELKGYWFRHDPNHPWYRQNQQSQQLSSTTAAPPALNGSVLGRESPPAAWKLKRLATRFDGFLLVQHCPDLIEYQLEFEEPQRRLRSLVNETPVSFKLLQICKRKLQVLDLSWRPSMYRQAKDLLTDIVETWCGFENLTDLRYDANELDQLLFLCEQQQVTMNAAPTTTDTIYKRSNISDDNNAAQHEEHRPQLQQQQQGVPVYPHEYLPHLQHLNIGVRFTTREDDVTSHAIYWILMTRSKLLTFKVQHYFLDTRLITPQTLMDLNLSSSSSSFSSSPTSHAVDYDTAFRLPLSSKESLEQRPNRFWACTRLEHLSLKLTFHPWISPADKKKIKDMDKHQKELELQIWRPFYQQLSQLSELKSLEIQSDQLRTSTESGILQLAEGTESLSETEGIPMTFCRAMYTTTAASSLSSSSSTTSSEAHDTDGCDGSQKRHQRFTPKLRKLRSLTLINVTRSTWSENEIHRLLLLLPSLERLDLGPLHKGVFPKVAQWIQQFGGVQSQDQVQDQDEELQGRRRVPVRLMSEYRPLRTMN